MPAAPSPRLTTARRHWSQRIAIITIALAATAWFTAIARTMVAESDYKSHVGAAGDLLLGVVRVPHLLFHASVALLIAIGLDASTAGVVATVFFQGAALCSVAWYIRESAPEALAPVVAILAFAVMLTGPVLPPGTDRDLYMTGYFLPNAMHNPTVIAAKAFVPLMLSVGAVASGLARRPAWRISGSASITVLAGLAKPHYVSCVVPAAGAWALLRVLTKRPIHVRLIVFGLGMPAALVLAGTYTMLQGISGESAAIVAPLAVLRRYVAVDIGSLVQRIISDVAFPLAVVACWPSVFRRVPSLAIAWTAYAIALGQGYLLAESGPRFADGNFLWSGQLATFGVMTASAAVLPLMLHCGLGAARARLFAATATLALQAAYGMWWVSARVPTTWWPFVLAVITMTFVSVTWRSRSDTDISRAAPW